MDTRRSQLFDVRRTTESLCTPLNAEDHGVQSMPDASPSKWHLAHTTWFFEAFVLAAASPAYRPFSEKYGFLFNSYYEGVGERHCRAARGLLSRPTLDEVHAYRRHVDGRIEELSRDACVAFDSAITLGVHHEQQHQELILTDIKHAFGSNPLRPAYRNALPPSSRAPAPPEPGKAAWHDFAEGVRAIGHHGDGFAFDNELPRHKVYSPHFSLASRLVTCGEFQAFIDDRGYARPELWLSDGWAAVKRNGWSAPLYWERERGSIFTLEGVRQIRQDEPVCHVSYYEADAFARWTDTRLPTEAEWEVVATGQAAATGQAGAGRFLDLDVLHPLPASGPTWFGDVWQWTSSAYLPYPGFRPAPGAVGEYNGKFMVNQHVLRGGCCATPPGHVRPTYRNFFPPGARWPFTGVRLARDADA
jgi:ergothioneine biosynthesis protein EgtB